MPEDPPDGSVSPRGAWQPLRRLLLQMLLLGLVVDLLALAWLGATGTVLRLHLVIALSVAIIGTLGLAGLLMGLLFLSNRSGADAAAGSHDPRE